jgi:hypothetical protein
VRDLRGGEAVKTAIGIAKIKLKQVAAPKPELSPVERGLAELRTAPVILTRHWLAEWEAACR